MNIKGRLGVLFSSLLLLATGCSANAVVGSRPCDVCDPAAECVEGAGVDEVRCVCPRGMWGDGTSCRAICERDVPGCCEDGQGCGRDSVCHDTTGTCDAPCALDADCADIDLRCVEGACVCEQGVCSPAPCTADLDCTPGLLCVAGACADEAPAADACELLPADVTVVAGESRDLRIMATARGAGVAPGPGWQLLTSDPGLVSVDSEGRVRAVGPTGAATITAARGEVRCEARVRTVAEAAPGVVRVAVVEAETGAPVIDARVVLSVAGVPAGNALTDERGLVDLADVETEIFDVTVFTEVPDDGTPNLAHVSVLGIRTRTVLLELPRDEAPDRAAGIRASVSDQDLDDVWPKPGDAALAGLSDPVLDAGLPERLLVGHAVEVQAHCYFWSDPVLIDFPTAWAVPRWPLLRNDLVASGRPGRRIPWALGVHAGAELPMSACDENSVGERAESFARHSLGAMSWVGSALTLTSSPVDPDTGLPDLTALAEVDPDPTMARTVGVEFAALDPDSSGLVLSGTWVPQRGFVPLGLGQRTQEAMVTRVAPLHSGLEGGEYMFLLFWPEALWDAGRWQRWSVRIARRDHLISGEVLALPPALPIPERYEGYERVYTAEAVEGATARRLVLAALNRRTWSVQHGADGTLALPNPMSYRCGRGPCEDRTQQHHVEAFAFDESFDALMRRGGLHAGDVLDRVQAFSTGGRW